MIGEEHRGLAGRVSGADQMHVEPLSDARFATRRPVEYAFAEQPVEPVHRQAPPTHSRRDDDGARMQRLLVVEDDAAGLRIDADDLAGDDKLRSQALGLPMRAAGKLRAGDPARKTQIILDPRRGLCLASGPLFWATDCPPPLVPPNPRGGEPRRPPADDDRVIFLELRSRLQAE